MNTSDDSNMEYLQFPQFSDFEARLKRLEDKLNEKEQQIKELEKKIVIIQKDTVDRELKAKLDFAISRKTELEVNSEESNIPELVWIVIVVLTSILTFGSVGKQVAEITGNDDEDAATRIGWVFGGLVGFLADWTGKNLFTGLLLQNDYNKQLENFGNSNINTKEKKEDE
ncbi:MAG: hypothetical protein ACFCUV_10820 [Rivularia sp. (in: cyanobacteria)]